DGSIIHIVRKGDTIYGIAFAYGIPVEELLRLNGLTLDTFIYVGKQLIIRPVFTPTPTSPTSTPTRRPTATPWLTSTATLTATSTALVATAAPKAAIPISSGVASVSVIILLALAIAGAVAWLGSRGANSNISINRGKR
ncbi:MAG: LysM peptidoglycan-binding domain-containing protein, partial [Chloroflexi bacterium]|nr:LysM peptidoglycan-binding domain-containing protein [Chloroflexota bacterium]